VVVSGNFATPHVLLHAVARALPRYRLWTLNAQQAAHPDARPELEQAMGRMHLRP
jgi:hypothetical protein